MRNFAAALRVQFRVISAIVLREVGSRHGGDAVGTFWLLLEPVIITLIVVVIHQASGAQIVQAGPVIVLLLTGYVPHLMFRHGGLAGIAALNANSGLPYHRQVHFVDLVFARLLVEIVTVLIAFLVIYFGFYVSGSLTRPNSLPQMPSAYGMSQINSGAGDPELQRQWFSLLTCRERGTEALADDAAT